MADEFDDLSDIDDGIMEETDVSETKLSKKETPVTKPSTAKPSTKETPATKSSTKETPVTKPSTAKSPATKSSTKETPATKSSTKDQVIEDQSTKDQDNINPNIDDLSWSDEIPEEQPEQNPEAVALLDKYKDLEVDDPTEVEKMADMMKDRKAFSERLEVDPEFRAKYIASEEARRKKIKSDDAEDIIGRLQGGIQGGTQNEAQGVTRESPNNIHVDDSDVMDELEDLEDIAGIHGNISVTKPGIFIQHVSNLTINITIK